MELVAKILHFLFTVTHTGVAYRYLKIEAQVKGSQNITGQTQS